ncbi:hypothetical protein Tco_0848846, partial [Tanacetum coccineum]
VVGRKKKTSSKRAEYGNAHPSVMACALVLLPYPALALPHGVGTGVAPPTSVGTDISKITRKQSKTGKHGHENQKSTKRSQIFKSRKQS